MSQYKSLAQSFISAIDDGKIKPGDKLMSVRALSQQHEVSVTTVLNCYAYMQDRGYANTRPKSGYFAQKPLLDLQEAPLMRFSGALSQPLDMSIKHGRHPFSTAQLSCELLPEKDMLRHLNHAFKTHLANSLAYGDPQGSVQLRSALVSHYGQHGFSFKESDVVIGHGCLDSVRVALQVSTEPGDTVVVASPCFSGLLDILKASNRQILEIPSTADGLDLLQLESIIKNKRASALLLTANFQNPLGHCFSNSHKRALAELASKYRFPVIEDDVYHELNFTGAPPLPIKHWDKSGHILWCSSFSKTLCASFRVGWCLPGQYLEKYKEQRKVESLGVNTPLQLAIADFIATGSYRQYWKKTLLKLREQVQHYRQCLAENLSANIAISNPAGGMVLWCYVKGLNVQHLAEALYKKQIGIRPGHLFSTRDFYSEYFRLNCGWPVNDERIKELKILCEEIKRLRPE